MNNSAAPRDQLAMSARIPETCPGKLERRYDTAHGWFVDGLSIISAAAVIAHHQPGILAAIVIFIGTYAVAHFLGEVLWQASMTWLCLLTLLIYLCTFVHATASLPFLTAILMTMFLPGIAQAYLIWDMWPATSSLLHPLPLLCLAWLIMFGIWIFEPSTFRHLTTAIKRRGRRV